MSELEMTNIQLARKFLANNEDQKALDYYLAAHEEDKDNAEASYWVYAAYLGQCVDSNASATDRRVAFIAASETFISAIEHLANSEGNQMDKDFVLIAFVCKYKAIASYAVQTQIATPKERIERAVVTLYKAGNAIEEYMGSDEEAMKMACELWKEGVKLQRKFYAYPYNGSKAEDYAAKIQKVEPGYVMPNKAGCISKG